MSTGHDDAGARPDAARTAGPTIYDVARLAGVAPSTVSRTYVATSEWTFSWTSLNRLTLISIDRGVRSSPRRSRIAFASSESIYGTAWTPRSSSVTSF